MKHFASSITYVILFFPLFCFAQRNCASMEVLDRLKAEDPQLESRMQAIERQTTEYLLSDPVQNRATITIPVVVHIIYRTSSENVSDAQVQSQIDVINADFRNLNSDKSQIPSEFASVVGNVNIEFCLAKTNPQGAATTGINRKSTTTTSWGTSDKVKKSAQGGMDPWNASKYLNLWICNIGGGILGYAQFPGGSAATDGVVIDYRYFGTIGTATSPFNKGRTATHEIGHWLNLRHIWGDTTCGNDQVSDTPVHDGANYGCPVYPHNSTCTDTPLEMTMNYMDYSDDVCMYMFSAGQAARMNAVLAPGGARYSLLSSTACQTSGGGGGTTCNAPTGLNATNITPTSATLNWTAAAGATAYKLQLRAVGTTTWTNSTVTTTTAAASNLTAATNYEFQIQTVCGNTSSTNFASANFTTQQVVACTDNYESNNTRTTAKTIAVGSVINGIISSSTDQDWFKFTNTSSQRNIKVQLSNLPADYDLSLYRGSTLINTSANKGTVNETIVYNNSRAATTYYVRVYGYNGALNTSNCYQLTATISGSSLRGENENVELEEIEAPKEFFVFPNPVSTDLMLDIPIESETPTKIYIFDMTGKLLQTNTQALSKDNTIAKVNIENLPNGIYVVRVQNGNFINNQKFIISR